MESVIDSSRIGQKLAPYNPTNTACVQQALELLKLQNTDVFFDLGCGDGRLLLEAKKRYPGIAVCGVEYDEKIYRQAVENLENCDIIEKSSVRLLHANVLDVEWTEATAIFVYLVPEGLALIRDKLIKVLQSGGRIVSYVFSIPNLNPVSVEIYKQSTKLYLYTRDSC